MDINTINHAVTDAAEYAQLQDELLADLNIQLTAQGLTLLSTQPNVFRFGAVVTDDTAERWVHVTIPSTAEDQFWAENVRLRRMSSERDWKGEEFHHCAWNEIGAQAKRLLSPEFDSEIL